MLERIKNICKKIPKPIDTLLVWVLLITVGVGIVVGLSAIESPGPEGEFLVKFLLPASSNSWMYFYSF